MLKINEQQNHIDKCFVSNRPPVIMQVIPALNGGGVEQGVVDINAALTSAGATSIVVSSGGALVHKIIRAGGIHIDLPVHSKNPLTIKRNIKHLKNIIQRYKVQLVHACSRAPAWSAETAAKDSDIHYVTSCHAAHNIGSGIKRFYNSSITKGDIVITVSNFLAEYLQTEYNVPAEKIRVIHRGVSLEKFHPNSVTPDRLIKISKDWRVPDGSSIIILPARLTRGKGHHECIDALKLLNHKNFFCVFAGKDKKGNYRAELEKHIQESRLNGQIRIIDHCDDLPAAYMISSVIVCPATKPEGFGRIPIEAQAMGRPVIATDHGGFQETIRSGETGWLIPSGDIKMLAQTIDTALSLDAGQRALLATQAMSHVANNFMNEKMCNETLSVYSELLQN